MLLNLRSGNRHAILVNDLPSQSEGSFHDGHQFSGPKLFQVFAIDGSQRLLWPAGDDGCSRKVRVARPQSKAGMARRDEADAPASLRIGAGDRHSVQEAETFARTLAMRRITSAGGFEPDLRIRERSPARVKNLATNRARRGFQAKSVFPRNPSHAFARPRRESRCPTPNEHPDVQSAGSSRIRDITVARWIRHQIP